MTTAASFATIEDSIVLEYEFAAFKKLVAEFPGIRRAIAYGRFES